MAHPPRIRLQDKCKEFALHPTAVLAMLRSIQNDLGVGNAEMEVEHFGIFSTKIKPLSYRAREFDFYNFDPVNVMKLRQPFRSRRLKFTHRAAGADCVFSAVSDEKSIRLRLSWSHGLVATDYSDPFGSGVVTEPMEQQRIGKTLSGVSRIFSQFTRPEGQKKFFIHVDDSSSRFFFGNGIDETERDDCRISVEAMTMHNVDSGQPSFFEFFPPHPFDGDKSMKPYAKAFLANLRWMMRNRTGGANTGPLYPEDLIVP